MYTDLYDDTCPPDISKSGVTVRCITGQGTGSLTESKLKTMIDSVYRIFSTSYSRCTVLTAPNSTLIMYTNGGGSHAEVNFINKNQGNLGSFPMLWINNSPCPNCSKELVTAYQNIANKPVIYAAHFYGGTSNASKETARMCLANMVAKGFTLKAFDWSSYSGLLTENDCKNDIIQAMNNANFTRKMQDMANTINTVNQYAQMNKTSCP